MPSISKSIRNHLHSKCRSKRLLIPAMLFTLSTRYTWPMMYFLLLFIFTLFLSSRISLLSSISDFLAITSCLSSMSSSFVGYFFFVWVVVTIWNTNYDWARVFLVISWMLVLIEQDLSLVFLGIASRLLNPYYPLQLVVPFLLWLFFSWLILLQLALYNTDLIVLVGVLVFVFSLLLLMSSSL